MTIKQESLDTVTLKYYFKSYINTHNILVLVSFTAHFWRQSQ